MTLWKLEELSTTGEVHEDCVPLSEKAHDYLNIGLGLIFFLNKSFNLYPNSVNRMVLFHFETTNLVV